MNNSRPSVILKYFRTKFVVGWLVSFLLFLSLGNRITFEGRKFFEIFHWLPLKPTPHESEAKDVQSCPILCHPMDYIVHGILQARILECLVFPFSSGSSQTRNRTGVSYMAGGFFTNWAIRKALKSTPPNNL